MKVEASSYLRNMMVSVVALGLLISLSACSSSHRRGVSPVLLGRIQYSMSEEAVVDLLGKPERVQSKRYRVGENEMARLLYYTLEDGRKWTIVINEKGELVGSGESGGSKEKKNSQKKNQAKGRSKKSSC